MQKEKDVKEDMDESFGKRVNEENVSGKDASDKTDASRKAGADKTEQEAGTGKASNLEKTAGTGKANNVEKTAEAGKTANDETADGAKKAAEAGDAAKTQNAGNSNHGTDSEVNSGDNAGENPGEKLAGTAGREKKDKKDEKIAELNDRLIRNMAEFDNFRKRTEKEKSQMFEMGAKSIVEKVLPVVDNFERGLAAIPDGEKENAFVQGMEQIYRQMMTMLEEAGVKPIDALGKEFDPNFHNAVMHVEDESFGENVVAEELQKGYLYKEAVVRHSMVKVAN